MNSKRVISLSPAGTEIIGALGRARQMVGRSHQCDSPEVIRALPACTSPVFDTHAASGEIDRQIRARVGSGAPLIDLNFEKIAMLQPELIFHSGSSGLEIAGAQCVRLKSARILDLWGNIQLVAEALEVVDDGREVISTLKNRLVDVIAKTCEIEKKPRVVCLDWIDPLTAAGLWIPELVEFAGGQPLISQSGNPSVPVEWSALAKVDPDILVFMLSGFDLARTRSEMGILDSITPWRGLSAVRNRKVFLVDASQLFSRPGPRLIDSLEVLAEIITPKEFRFGGEGKRWLRW